MNATTPVPVLLYHSIRDAPTPGYGAWETSPARLRAHLEHLEATGRTPIALDTYARWLRAEPGVTLPDRPVVVTFDDGLANFCDVASLFVERGCPATLFVPTAYVGGDTTWLAPELRRKMLSWSQIADLDRSGIEIGSHSHLHRPIDTEPARVVRAEVARSRALLEDHLGHACPSFAYPHGYSSPRVREIVRRAGFARACAVKDTMSGAGDDPFAIARLFVGWDDVGPAFERLLVAGHRRRPRLREQVLTVGWRSVRRARSRLHPSDSARVPDY